MSVKAVRRTLMKLTQCHQMTHELEYYLRNENCRVTRGGAGVKLHCNTRFQRAFTACGCVFKVINLVLSKQRNYWKPYRLPLHAVNACWKRVRMTNAFAELFSGSELPMNCYTTDGQACSFPFVHLGSTVNSCVQVIVLWIKLFSFKVKSVWSNTLYSQLKLFNM